MVFNTRDPHKLLILIPRRKYFRISKCIQKIKWRIPKFFTGFMKANDFIWNICFLFPTKPREIANVIWHSSNMNSFEELRAQVTAYLEIFQMTLLYAFKQCKRGFRHYLKSMGWGSLISSHIGSVRYTKEARLVSTTQQYIFVHCDLKEIFKICCVFIIGFQIFLTLSLKSQKVGTVVPWPTLSLCPQKT